MIHPIGVISFVSNDGKGVFMEYNNLSAGKIVVSAIIQLTGKTPHIRDDTLFCKDGIIPVTVQMVQREMQNRNFVHFYNIDTDGHEFTQAMDITFIESLFAGFKRSNRLFYLVNTFNGGVSVFHEMEIYEGSGYNTHSQRENFAVNGCDYCTDPENGEPCWAFTQKNDAIARSVEIVFDVIRSYEKNW